MDNLKQIDLYISITETHIKDTEMLIKTYNDADIKHTETMELKFLKDKLQFYKAVKKELDRIVNLEQINKMLVSKLEEKTKDLLKYKKAFNLISPCIYLYKLVSFYKRQNIYHLGLGKGTENTKEITKKEYDLFHELIEARKNEED